MKKLLSVLLAVSLLLGMVSLAAAEGGEKVTIQFYEHSDGEVTAKRQVEEFEAANPDIHVELHIIANDDYDDKIKVMMAGDADIDVLWLRSPGQGRNMYTQGALLGLNDLMAANGLDKNTVNFSEAYTADDGQQFGIATTKSCWLLWYNKDLFEATGKELPGDDLTWEQYADLCASLTTDEYMGGVFPTWVMGLGASAAGNWLDDEDLTITKDYMKILHRIYCEDHSNYDLEDMTGSFDVNGVFSEGNTYLMINGDWTFSLLEADFEWGALPLPHMSSIPANSSVGSAAMYGINSKCEHPEEAFKFIQFCNASDAGAEIYAANASVACFNSESALAIYKEQITIPGTEYVFSSSVRPEDSFISGYEEIKDAFVAEMQEYLLDQKDLDAAFDSFLTKRAAILNK